MKTDHEFHIRENITFGLKDAAGKSVKLFQDGLVNKMVLSLFRDSFGIRPIADDGSVKPGILNHIAAYGLRIPLLTGNWVSELKVANLVTSAGKAGIASRFNGNGGEAAFTYIALGIGTTAANVADTALESEIVDSGLTRSAATVSRVTTNVTNDTARQTFTWTASGSKAVTESGVLNAASTGTLANRQVFSAVNLVSGNSFQATHDFAFS
jgi:hypothetical protein